MSHYAVAVFHHKNQDIDALLAPYDENITVPKHIEMTRQQAIDDCRKYHPYADSKTDEECYQYYAEQYDADMIDEEGNLYSTYNPKSKWDWYSIGGRFSDLLIDKDDYAICFDSARARDVNFKADKDVYEYSLKFWDAVVDGKKDESGEEYFTLYNRDYYIERYHDKETYANIQSRFSTYATVTPDGEWHAPGEMGWFACTSETGEEARAWYENYYKDYIQPAIDNDWWITIVDCHI